MPSRKEAVHGLRLILPGAPSTAHWVAGIPGYYWPDKPTPIGGPGEVTLEQAQAIVAKPEPPVELVEMTPSEADTRRAEIEAFVREEANPAIAEELKAASADEQPRGTNRKRRALDESDPVAAAPPVAEDPTPEEEG